MKLSDYPRITTYLSKARLQPYINHAPPNVKDKVEYGWRVYLWNIDVSSAFWGPIGILEVALRNSFADILTDAFGPSWWESDHLLKNDRQKVERVIQKYQTVRAGEPVTPDDVVSDLSLGFWSALTGPGVVRDPKRDYNTHLWVPHLSHAFPNLREASSRRKQVHGVLNDIRQFRNRIAHREPIVLKHSLHHQFDQILEACAWIDSSLQFLVTDTSTVREAIQRRSAALKNGEYRI